MFVSMNMFSRFSLHHHNHPPNLLPLISLSVLHHLPLWISIPFPQHTPTLQSPTHTHLPLIPSPTPPPPPRSRPPNLRQHPTHTSRFDPSAYTSTCSSPSQTEPTSLLLPTNLMSGVLPWLRSFKCF